MSVVTVSKPSADQLDIELSGSLRADDTRPLIDELIGKSEESAHRKMLFRVKDVEMPSMGAIVVAFEQMPKIFSLIGKFEKCTFLLDAACISTATGVEGTLIPPMDVKSFLLYDKKLPKTALRAASKIPAARTKRTFPSEAAQKNRL